VCLSSFRIFNKEVNGIGMERGSNLKLSSAQLRAQSSEPQIKLRSSEEIEDLQQGYTTYRYSTVGLILFQLACNLHNIHTIVRGKTRVSYNDNIQRRRIERMPIGGPTRR
jgi:hypothetical protein